MFSAGQDRPSWYIAIGEAKESGGIDLYSYRAIVPIAGHPVAITRTGVPIPPQCEPVIVDVVVVNSEFYSTVGSP